MARFGGYKQASSNVVVGTESFEINTQASQSANKTFTPSGIFTFAEVILYVAPINTGESFFKFTSNSISYTQKLSPTFIVDNTNTSYTENTSFAGGGQYFANSSSMSGNAQMIAQKTMIPASAVEKTFLVNYGNSFTIDLAGIAPNYGTVSCFITVKKYS